MVTSSACPANFATPAEEYDSTSHRLEYRDEFMISLTWPKESMRVFSLPPKLKLLAKAAQMNEIERT